MMLMGHDAGNAKQAECVCTSPRTRNPSGSCGTLNAHTNARTSSVLHVAALHREFVTRTLGGLFDGSLGDAHPMAASAARHDAYRTIDPIAGIGDDARADMFFITATPGTA
jgi:hypothetical protein